LDLILLAHRSALDDWPNNGFGCTTPEYGKGKHNSSVLRTGEDGSGGRRRRLWLEVSLGILGD
jgi:hypothetical protein